MKRVNREDCDTCLGIGKVKVVPLTDAPIWEREKEFVIIDCDLCIEN